MALLTNPGTPHEIVQRIRASHGHYGNPTPAQLHAIQKVINDDEAGRLNRDQIVARLNEIGDSDEAA